MIYNYIPVAIGEYYKVTGPSISYQYDVKQYLVLTGVVLPEFFLVDFCNEGDTTTMPMTGTGNTVEIPDACLLTGKRIKAYIVVSGLDAGASETRIEITLPVNRRPARTDIEPTPAEQSTIDSLIEAMNTAVEDTGDAKTAAETAQGKAEDAQAAAERAQDSAEQAAAGVPEAIDTALAAAKASGEFDGADGVSPTVSVTEITGGHQVTVTDAEGSQSFNVMDGDDYVLTSEDEQEIAGIVRDVLEVTLTGRDITLAADPETRYLCGELDTLALTPAATGMTDIVFTSGTTPTVVTLPGTVKMPEWYTIAASRIYEINIMDGVYGAVISWPA